MPPLLTQEEIDGALTQVQGWGQAGRSILKAFSFTSFKEAMGFVNRVAELAEEIDHHPDIAVSYTRVTLSITTHVSDGLTRRDFRLARRIDELP